jgi:chitinase
MLKIATFFCSIFLYSLHSFSQIPNPALVGYWHNWNDGNAPYIPLNQIDSRYNIIDISFAIPQPGTDYNMQFIPDQVSQQLFITQVEALQNEGRKVIISVGGATAPVYLDDEFERDIFVSSMGNILNTYGFDGIDIDLEGSSTIITGGTIEAPANAGLINLIEAVRQIMANYYNDHGARLLLTMAPETAFVQGGMSAFGGIWGGYLPVIHALRDSIEILHVQLYNSGSMYGIDGGIYTQGTADFIVAMTEAVIQGFATGGGFFEGLPASKIAVGLPACGSAAGGGFTQPAVVQSAINYLRGMGPQPGSYSLSQSGGYPDLRGMMTWSINWDAVSNCGASYEYAQNFEDIFESITMVQIHAEDLTFKIYPNPTLGDCTIELNSAYNAPAQAQIFNSHGQLMMVVNLNSNRNLVNLNTFPSGLYYVRINELVQKVIKK